MKVIACLAAIAAIVGNCQNPRGRISSAMTEHTIEYQSGKNEYSVVVVEMKGLTMAEAKRIAEVKAAEMASDDGYRYITFDATHKTEVIQSNQPWPDSQTYYGNKYKELILDGDFERDRLAREMIPSESIHPAYRFVFKAAKAKTNWKAVDVCTLTNCR